MPLQDEDLFSYLSDSILNSKDVTISTACFLNPNRQSRMEKRVYSVVVNVEPDSVQTMLPSIYLFGNSRTVEKPTLPLPSPSASGAGSMVTSNHYVKRRFLHASCAPSNTPRPSIAAPTPHPPAGETLKPYLGAASPPQPDAPTVGKRTRPGAGTALNDHPLQPHEMPRRRRKPYCRRPRPDGHPPRCPTGRSQPPCSPGIQHPPPKPPPPFPGRNPTSHSYYNASPPCNDKISLQGRPPPPPRGRLAPHLPRATQQAEPGKMSYTRESSPPGLGP